ncbi:MAG TPA: DUF6370 family protein [Vicinamibacteria bacterium]|jgi:hypothetical protein
MRSRAVALAAVLAVLGAAVAARAGDDVTLKGTIVCAKCTLKKADAKECQNVLLAKDADGKEVEYYMAKSEAADAVGEVCTGKKAVTVTGTVSEKDGRKWITASKVESKS